MLSIDAAKSPAVPSTGASGRRIRRIIGGLLVLIPILFLLYFFVALTFVWVPPILVRVVDAVSGKPVAGIEVKEEFEAYHLDSVPRPQSKVTGSSGYVFFSPYLQWKGFAILSGIVGYSINVNENSMAAKPWRRHADLGSYQTDNYFPMILRSRCPNCVLLWKAPDSARQDLGSSWSRTVPLIPVLSSPDKCTSIADSTVSKQCKDLNIYRSAFLRFNTVQDVENNNAICRQLEEQSAKSCLDELAGFVVHAMDNPPPSHPSPFESRPMPMLPTLPLEQVFPFDSVGGLTIGNRRSCCNNAFTGGVTYIASYGWASRQISVKIEDYTTQEVAQKAFAAMTSSPFDNNPQSTTSEEVRSGNRVFVHRTPHLKSAYGESGSESVYWRSTNKVILIYMFLPKPEYEDAVTKYLALYPSSLSHDASPRTRVRILGEGGNR